MRPVHPRAAVLTLSLLMLFAPLAGADVLVNGNFEDGPAISPTDAMLAVPAGNPALPGWSVSSGTVVVVSDGYWVPLSGTRSLNLSDNRPASTSTVPGAVQQTIATAPGATYRLTFWVSGEPFSSPTIKHLRVQAGPVQQDYTFDNTPAWHWDMAWAAHALDFTAVATSSTVRFAGLDASKWGPAIDSVKVELVSAGVGTPGATLSFARVAPDPVRGQGRLAFTLSEPGRARLTVVDIQGRELARLADNEFASGGHAFEFSPSGWGAGPGLYFAVLQAGGRTLVRRFTVLH